MKIEFINRNENGDYYIGFKVKVQRGIKGKTKSKVDELLIVGVPQDQFHADPVKYLKIIEEKKDEISQLQNQKDQID